MLGKLMKILVPELRFVAAEEIIIESGVPVIGELKQEVQVIIKPQSRNELAIVMRLTYDGRRSDQNSESDVPMFSCGCLVIGVYPFDRALEQSDVKELTDDVTTRSNLQIFPIARGKLLRLLNEVGFNSPDFPLENPLNFPLVVIPSPESPPKKPAPKRKRKTK